MAEQPSQAEPPCASHDAPQRSHTLAGMLIGFCLWLGLWALLSHGQGWAFGIPLAALATFAAARLQLAWRPLRLRAFGALLLFFLRELFSGGWDVARRALHPCLPVDPGWQTFSLTTRNPRVRLLLSAMVGLLPGTLSSHFEANILHVHALDRQQDWQATVARLEQLLTDLLGEQ